MDVSVWMALQSTMQDDFRNVASDSVVIIKNNPAYDPNAQRGGGAKSNRE